MKENSYSSGKELLISFFNRDNPNGDCWIYEGFGPRRRHLDRYNLRESDGKWNIVPISMGVERDMYPLMPNPDTLVTSLTVPCKNSSFNLIKMLSDIPNGPKWIDNFRNYLNGNQYNVPEETNFKIQIKDMPSLNYQFIEGEYKSRNYFDNPNTIWNFKEIPNGAVYGEFHSDVKLVPLDSRPNGIGLVNIFSSGGSIGSDDGREGYILSNRLNLIGELNREDLSTDKPFSLMGSFPLTHFVEYILGRNGNYGEKNLCPGIRVELKPEEGQETTLQREKSWADETKRKWNERHEPYWMHRYA